MYVHVASALSPVVFLQRGASRLAPVVWLRKQANLMPLEWHCIKIGTCIFMNGDMEPRLVAGSVVFLTLFFRGWQRLPTTGRMTCEAAVPDRSSATRSMLFWYPFFSLSLFFCLAHSRSLALSLSLSLSLLPLRSQRAMDLNIYLRPFCCVNLQKGMTVVFYT